MATKTLTVKLSGKSQLHEPIIRLENVSLNLFSVDGGETWENKGILIDINGNLDIFMSCKALSHTGWEFKVADKNTKNSLYEVSGHTGDISPNYSEINVTV